MEYSFRRAELTDLPDIWLILQKAILRRKEDGSNQWQDGYPNPEVIQTDIEKRAGFVMTEIDTIVGYCAIFINDEPAYAALEGKWLTEGDFAVFHRVAISEDYIGMGLSKTMLSFIETFAIENNLPSLKADTNFDNPAMQRIFEKSGYIYCGEVFFRGNSRMAYEKVIKN
ncbi:MAG: GNAT family N-acetyltransferase [Pedobacter sp.]|nr:MAG: GNAT family N-acetyltransferase [Pedobacter sp.]